MTCPGCGAHDDTIGTRASMRADLCLACDIAVGHREIVAAGGFVIDGRVYRVGSESSADRGFGGRSYTIAAFDGRTITTTNLHAIGMTAKLPDNAHFYHDGAIVRLAA